MRENLKKLTQREKKQPTSQKHEEKRDMDPLLYRLYCFVQGLKVIFILPKNDQHHIHTQISAKASIVPSSKIEFSIQNLPTKAGNNSGGDHKLALTRL